MRPILLQIGPVLIPSFGAMAALGVLLGLALVLRTAQMAGLSTRLVWNLCIVALFAALIGSRLLLVAVNWAIVRNHPSWAFGLAMVHHPLLAAAGSFFAALAAWIYLRQVHLPLAGTADALAPPLALGLACEQLGALLAGSGFGTETTVRWAVVYSSPIAARWSGTPLGVPVHPVQVYAALSFLTISIVLLACMRFRGQAGDIAGLWLVLSGTAIYLTECYRDPLGRGSILHGALDGPQVAAIAFVLLGGLVLRKRQNAAIESVHG